VKNIKVTLVANVAGFPLSNTASAKMHVHK
jgi:hypothetical protein